MTGPVEGVGTKVTETAVLKKFDQDTTGMTEDEIAELPAVEVITIVDGTIVDHWKRDEA